jgi:hypothetical protein
MSTRDHEHHPHPTRRSPVATGQQVLAHAKASPPASDIDDEWLIINALRLAIVHTRGCKCQAQTGVQARQMLEDELDAALAYAVEKRVGRETS